eukprot:TRINITY_DN90_c0_g1_i4.p1 TRINITY_DN90_c0_g1~~TRINITY_DN90_c0_g1_i4.p1  ORF type:complete len:203 (-),score=106.96 TRINITY_DN90_c0_g1_i4:35-643(-)
MATSLNELLEAKRANLNSVETIITSKNGEKFRLSKETGELIKLNEQQSFGFVIDTKPDPIPAQVRPFLFIGSQDAAASLEHLTAAKITHILNVATGIEPIFPHQFKYCSIALFDDEQQNLLSAIEQSIEFIDEAKQSNQNQNQNQGAVLVHCNAGISRSASIVIAYLMKKENLTYEQALNQVKAVRSVVKPNINFEMQLKAL